MTHPKHKVLIVEDHEDARANYADILAEEGGFEIETAENGRAALDWLAQGRRPDLILTDVQMPCMNGIELAGHVKSDPDTRSIPIIAMTGRPESYKEAALKAGCCYIVSKTDVFTEAFMLLLRRLASP